MPKYHAYVVFVGTQPGVYRSWQDVTKRCTGVSGASFKGYGDWKEAQEVFERAHAEGDTRVVHPGPPLSPQDSLSSRSRPPRAKTGPTQQTSSATAESGSTASGRSQRVARIAAALEELKRSEGGTTASALNAGVIRRTDGISGKVVTAATTVPSRRPPVRVVPAPPIASAQVEHAVPVLAAQQGRPIGNRGNSAKKPKSRPSTSSSPATAVTQTKNIFTPSPGPASSSPRYAQSLSYASSPENWSAGLQSPSLASSDRRTHLSSPSSLGTRYFPEDWLAREAHIKSMRAISGTRAHSPAITEYATAPNTPEVQSATLLDVQRLANMTIASYEESSAPSTLSRTGQSTVTTSPERPSAKSAATLSHPSSSSVGLARAHSTPTAKLTTRKTKRLTPVSRSYSEAEVQTEPPRARYRKLSEVAVQTASSPKTQHVDEGAQTSARATPLRATVGIGDVPVCLAADGPMCVCEHPETACLHCGLPPRVTKPVAGSLVPPASPSIASPTSATTQSPASFATPMSAVSLSSRAPPSPVRGHTPRMGPSEVHRMPPPNASLQAGLDVLTFTETARGVEAVVHDVHFDPRSPIQRGTNIPAGSFGMAVRPSPAMAPVPMSSLLFAP